MQGILSNLKIKIIAWVLAAMSLLIIGIFVENSAEKRFNEQNNIEYVNDHDLDDIFR